ncbi:hypothetical protein AAG570_006822 [Ranatra chinensis]|uniref:Uncharacterized protein n=1 Tax=Ranatra chinensis TaxID=642074 RepID=A0ABD0YV61_9HEMI
MWTKPLIVVFCFHLCSGQLSESSQVPRPTLQATRSGYFRAYVPDACGIEKFKFEWKNNDTEKWTIAEVDRPIDGYWISQHGPLPVQPIRYRSSVVFNGKNINLQEIHSNSSDLVDEFSPLPPNVDACQRTPVAACWELTGDIWQELTELKKLNYAMVAKMRDIEAIIASATKPNKKMRSGQ